MRALSDRKRRGGVRWPARHALLLAFALSLLVASGPFATPAHGRAGAREGRKTILIDNSERVHGRSPLLPLWESQLAGRYTVRRHGGAVPMAMPGRDQDFRIVPTVLAGVDLFIVTGFDGSITVGDRSGSREVDYNLSEGEIATLESFVRGGGTLVILPERAGRPNNLGTLLARFGIGYRDDDAIVLGERTLADGSSEVVEHRFAATFAGKPYALSAFWWLHPVQLPSDGTATTLAAHDGKALIGEVSAGAGKVFYMGANGLAASTISAIPQGAVAADNPVFFHDLIAHGVGVPALTPAEARRATWTTRMAALEPRFFQGRPGDGATRVRSRQAEWADDLLQAAAREQRCGLGYGCVAWQITAEQRAFLEDRRDKQMAMLAAFDRLDGALRDTGTPTADAVPGLEGEYAAILTVLGTDSQQRQKFEALYRAQGGIVPSYNDSTMTFILSRASVLLLPLALFLFIFAVNRMIRRRRRLRTG